MQSYLQDCVTNLDIKHVRTEKHVSVYNTITQSKPALSNYGNRVYIKAAIEKVIRDKGQPR